LTRAAYFMPLRGEHDAGPMEIDEGVPGRMLQRLPAPWAGWFERRHRRTQWLSFIQALTFYGYLRGLRVHYRSLPQGHTVFGLSDPPGGAVCWLGSQDWQVSGTAGRDLGATLWRNFLDAGGPWPTEFELRAWPGRELTQSGREAYKHQGPRCQQVWELIENRDRPAWL
jgi:hypothetical protein